MRCLRHGLLSVVVIVALLARADGMRQAWAAGDKAAAEELFREGRRLAKEGNFVEACPKFEGSQSLDPATGTLLNLADCYEKVGRTASAWAAFLEVAELSRKEGNSKRTELAEQRARALEPRLSRLTINVPAASRLPGLLVLRDASTLPEATFGLALPVDPGKHEIVAIASGHERWITVVEVAADGARVTVDVPPLTRTPEPPVAPPPAPAPIPPTSTTPGPTPAPTTTAPAPTIQEPRSLIAPVNPPEQHAKVHGPLSAAEKAKMRRSDEAPPNRRKEGAIFAIVLGGGSLVATGVLGYLSMSARDESAQYCPHDVCLPKGKDLISQADTLSLAATIAGVTGALVLTGGIILYATAPSNKPGGDSASAKKTAARTRLAPALGPEGFSLQLVGTF